MTHPILDAVTTAFGVGTGLALDAVPLRARRPVTSALRAVACVPVIRWVPALPLAALGGGHLALRRWHAWRVARREIRCGRW